MRVLGLLIGVVAALGGCAICKPLPHPLLAADFGPEEEGEVWRLLEPAFATVVRGGSAPMRGAYLSANAGAGDHVPESDTGVEIVQTEFLAGVFRDGTADGVIEFFARARGKDPASTGAFRPLDWTFGDADGTPRLRLAVSNRSYDGPLVAELSTPPGRAIEDSTGDHVDRVAVRSSKALALGDINHLALTFATDPAGWITMRLFVEPHGEAIDTTHEPDDFVRFRFRADVMPTLGDLLLQRGTLGIVDPLPGRTGTMDIDTLRVYDAVPWRLP